MSNMCTTDAPKLEKKVPALRFPEFKGNWKKVQLGDIATFKKGKGISKADIDPNGPTRCVRYGELYTTYNHVIKKVLSKTSINIQELVLSEGGEVLILASGETRVDIATAAALIDSGVAIGGDLNILTTDADSEWLARIISSVCKAQLASLGQGNSVVHLYPSQIRTVKLYRPSLPEQRVIVAFLSIVDAQVKLLEKRVQLLKKWKQGVLGKIFREIDRRIRSNKIEDQDWKKVKVGTLIQENRIKGNSGDTANKLTVKLWGKGVVANNETYQGSINTQYYRRNSGQFIYSKLDFLNCAFAIIPQQLDGYESTLDLPALDFAKHIEPLYFLERVKCKDFYQRLGEQADGSRKARRIQVDTFLNFDFPLPPIQNQGETSEIIKLISAYQLKSQKTASRLKLWLGGISTMMLRCE